MPAEPSIPSVWAREAARRDPQGLNRNRIVSEARLLLDEEGLDALSMRSLGKRLDAGATSLYRHVANKDELIELVVDEVYAEVEVPDPSDEWREDVSAAAGSLRHMVLRHPWVAGVLGQVGLAYLGPNLARASERMLGLLTAAGFEPGEADQAINTVIAYVIGTVTSETAWLSMVARSGKTEQELIESLQEVQEHLTQTPAAREHNDAARYRDDSFAFGLDVVLDGLDARLRRKA